MATAELVYRLARMACVPIDRDIATCLYTALMTDTGSFMFEGTDEQTFTVARELVLAGADPAQCARQIYFGHSTAKMRLLGAALSNLHREGPLAWIWVTQEQMERFGAREEDCEGLVNYALSMADVQVADFLSRASRPPLSREPAQQGRRSTSRPLRSSLAAEATGALAGARLKGRWRLRFRALLSGCEPKRQ